MGGSTVVDMASFVHVHCIYLYCYILSFNNVMAV